MVPPGGALDPQAGSRAQGRVARAVLRLGVRRGADPAGHGAGVARELVRRAGLCWADDPALVHLDRFTFYNNRFQVDDAAHRLLVFGQMLAIGAVAASVPKVLDGQHQTFALAYGVARLAVVAMYARAHAQVRQMIEEESF